VGQAVLGSIITAIRGGGGLHRSIEKLPKILNIVEIDVDSQEGPLGYRCWNSAPPSGIEGIADDLLGVSSRISRPWCLATATRPTTTTTTSSVLVPEGATMR
jgi:hypothetical protein